MRQWHTMHEDQRLLNMTELALTQLDVWMISDKWEIDQKIALGKWKWPIFIAVTSKKFKDDSSIFCR